MALKRKHAKPSWMPFHCLHVANIKIIHCLFVSVNNSDVAVFFPFVLAVVCNQNKLWNRWVLTISAVENKKLIKDLFRFLSNQNGGEKRLETAFNLRFSIFENVIKHVSEISEDEGCGGRKRWKTWRFSRRLKRIFF